MSEKKYILGESAARRLRAMFRAGEDIRSGGGISTALVDPRTAPHPFKVMYSSTYGSDGAWLIYLPAYAWCGSAGRSALTAATGMDDWYVVSTSLSDGTPIAVGSYEGELYLSTVHVPKVVATVGVDSTTLAKSVNQLVRSAITSPAGPFEIYRASMSSSATLYVSPGYYRTGDAINRYDCGEISVGVDESAAKTIICLKVPASMYGGTATLEAVSPSNIASYSRDLSYAYLPLYIVSTKVANLGEVICDLRGIPTSVQFEVQS